MQETAGNEGAPLRVAVGLAPSGEISPTHFGDSHQVLLALVRDGGFQVLERKLNPMKVLEETHGDEAKLGKASDFLKDVQVVVSGRKSPNFVKLREKKGKWPVVAQGDPEAFLRWLAAHRKEVEEWFSSPENQIYRAPMGET